MSCLNLKFDGTLYKIIPLKWNWSKDYFDMQYIIFEAMEGEEIAIFA